MQAISDKQLASRLETTPDILVDNVAAFFFFFKLYPKNFPKAKFKSHGLISLVEISI